MRIRVSLMKIQPNLFPCLDTGANRPNVKTKILAMVYKALPCLISCLCPHHLLQSLCFLSSSDTGLLVPLIQNNPSSKVPCICNYLCLEDSSCTYTGNSCNSGLRMVSQGDLF